jgi:nucleotide-binding universal stress UspA family protein
MTREIKKIVVGTSLSDASDEVVQAALTLSRRTGAALYLAHAFPMPVAYGGGIYGTAALPHELEIDENRCRRQIDEQLEKLGASVDDFAGVVVDIEAPHRLLEQVAEREAADLVVVGAHEAHGLLGGFLGSTADRLLRHSTRPVLVVRGKLEGLARVVAPVDLSELSERCFAQGLELLGQGNGGQPFHVETLFVLSSIDREGSAHFQPAQMDRFAMEELTAFLGRAPQPPGVELKPMLRSGQPRDEILDFLAQHRGDLVLLGTHGRSGLERMLLGSVASEVLRRLDRHALVIPPPNNASDEAAG